MNITRTSRGPYLNHSLATARPSRQISSISSKSRLRLGAVSVLIGLAATALGTSADATPRSLPVNGSFESHYVTEGCTSQLGVCLADTFRGTLNGPAEATVSSFAPTPAPGVSAADFTFVIHDSQGDLSCRAQAVFDTASSASEFAFLCQVTGGTRRYAAASGYLLAHGAIPPGETAFQGTYDGKIVLAS